MQRKYSENISNVFVPIRSIRIGKILHFATNKNPNIAFMEFIPALAL